MPLICGAWAKLIVENAPRVALKITAKGKAKERTADDFIGTVLVTFKVAE